MKTYKTIDDAIYEIADQQIERRRRNPTLGLIFIVAGASTALSAYFFGGTFADPAIQRALMLGGTLMAFVGIVKMIIDMTSRAKFYYKPSGSELRRYEFRFDTPYLMKVRQCLEDGDLAALTRLPSGHSEDVKAVIYKTENNDLMLGQAFGYKRPMCETKIFEKGTFTYIERPA